MKDSPGDKLNEIRIETVKELKESLMKIDAMEEILNVQYLKMKHIKGLLNLAYEALNDRI